MMKAALFILMLLTTTRALAEYRVYQYYIKSKVAGITSPNAQVVTSTLNPESYKAYHGGSSSIDLTLLRSWMCFGNTSYQDVCTISEGKELAASSSAETLK